MGRYLTLDLLTYRGGSTDSRCARMGTYQSQPGKKGFPRRTICAYYVLPEDETLGPLVVPAAVEDGRCRQVYEMKRNRSYLVHAIVGRM